MEVIYLFIMLEENMDYFILYIYFNFYWEYLFE